MNAEQRSGVRQPTVLGNNSGNPREIAQRSLQTISGGDSRRLLVPPEGRLLFRAEPRLKDTKPKTLEATIKERLFLSSMSQLSDEHLSAGRAAIFFDTRDDISSSDKLGFYIYLLWHRSGSLNMGLTLLGVSHERQRRLMIPVMEDEKKTKEYQDSFDLLEATEKVIEGRVRKFEFEKFGKIADRVSDLLNQGMTIDDIGLDFKKLVLTWLRTDNEKESFVNEVERLSLKGLKAKEIAPMLGLAGTSIVEDVIRGLIVVGRLKPRRNSERTRQFIELARKVEIYRKRKKNKLTNYEIASKLGVTPARVRDAARVLIAVGRIEPFSMSEVQRIKLGTYENKEKLRSVLENAQSDGQKKIVLSHVISEADLTYKRTDPVSILYREIEDELEGQVPRIASNSRERARNKLRELVAAGATQLNLRQVSRDEDIPYSTLIRAYHDIENEPEVPKLKQNVAAEKRDKLRRKLAQHLSIQPGKYFNMRQASKEIGASYTLSLRWYHEIAEAEVVPQISPRGQRNDLKSAA